MASYEPLVYEYRGGLLDLTHMGYCCIVDEHSKVLTSVGKPEETVYYRSASKPIQALPVIAMGLDKKYGITEEESVIFAGSHAGEPFHVKALQSVFEKAGLREEQLIMNPAYPAEKKAYLNWVRSGEGTRKFYHNCAGKHAALLLGQRELGGITEDYWKTDAAIEQEVLRTISVLSETTPEKIGIGVDGCGVPVFATGMKNIAAAFKNLACLDTIRDDKPAEAAAVFVPRIHRYPHMMRGTDYLCSKINEDANIIAKGGANGVYGLGLKRERIGISVKAADGCEDIWPFVLAAALRSIGYENQDTLAMLDGLHGAELRNDNGLVVGHWEMAAKL